MNIKTRRVLCDYFGKTSKELGLMGRNWSQDDEQTASRLPAPAPLQSPVIAIPAPLLHKQPAPVQHTPTQALDLLCETPDLGTEQHAGAWLTLGASHLGQLFDNGWSLEGILDSLRVVLQGVQGMPAITRRGLLQLGGMAAIGGIRLPEGERVTEEERRQLTEGLGRSIGEAWKLFHTIETTQVLAISQALLALVKQNHYHLYSEVLPMFYSGLYRLIGATLYFQERHDEAWKAFEQAYLTALEGIDRWNMAQSRSWQAYTLHAQEHYAKALQSTDGALLLIGQQDSTDSLRLRARLLAFGAENAAIVGDSRGYLERSDASKQLLEYLPDPNEEFDSTGWLQQSGVCALRQGQYELAANQLQHALDILPPQWTLRYISTSIPLANSMTHLMRVEESLAISRQTLSVIKAIRSARMTRQFIRFIHEELLAHFPNNQACQTFITDAQQALSVV